MTAELPAGEFDPNEEDDLEQYSTDKLIAMIQGMLGENYDVSTLSRNEIIRTLESLRQIAKETESRRAPIVTTKEKKEKKEEVEEPEKPVKKPWWQTGQYE